MKILSNRRYNRIIDIAKSEYNIRVGWMDRCHNSNREIRRLEKELSEANKCLDAYRNPVVQKMDLPDSYIKLIWNDPVVQTNPVINNDLEDWKDAQKFKLFEECTKDTGQGIFDKLADQMNLLNWKIEKEKESELEFNKWKSEEIKKFNKAAMCYSINGEIYKQELVFTKTK